MNFICDKINNKYCKIIKVINEKVKKKKYFFIYFKKDLIKILIRKII
jgi:hypothetical protein